MSKGMDFFDMYCQIALQKSCPNLSYCWNARGRSLFPSSPCKPNQICLIICSTLISIKWLMFFSTSVAECVKSHHLRTTGI